MADFIAFSSPEAIVLFGKIIDTIPTTIENLTSPAARNPFGKTKAVGCNAVAMILCIITKIKVKFLASLDKEYRFKIHGNNNITALPMIPVTI